MTQRIFLNFSGLGRMLAVWGALLLWHSVSDRLGCVGSALFLAPLWLALTLAASERALFRRYAFVAQYLRLGGRLARLLRRRLVLFLWQGAKSLFLALILFVSAVFLDRGQWLAMLADTLAMSALVALFARLLNDELKPGYREFLSRHWAHWVNAPLLWLSLVLVMFYTPHENYTGMPWQEVARLSAANVALGCDELAFLGRINAVGEALAWWGAQNFLQGLEHPAQILVAWLAFIAFFGVSFLIAWAYSRALVGVLSRPWAIDPDKLSARD